MTGLLTVERLVVVHARAMVLRGIDLNVQEGQVVCLIGPNGAGKTTLLRTLSGLLTSAAGHIRLNGTELTGLAPHRIAGLGLLHVPEGRQVFAGLTVAENLSLGAWLVDDRAELARRRDQVLERLPRLRERLPQPAGALSGGEQQMLALGRALMGAPRLLLLDQPSLGLAPPFVEEVFALIAELRREGRSILLVEQNAAMALEVADYAYVMETGRVVRQGAASAVAAG